MGGPAGGSNRPRAISRAGLIALASVARMHSAGAEHVAPPIVLHAVGAAGVSRKPPEPPDHEPALGSTPGARIANGLVPREIREVRPVIWLREDPVGGAGPGIAGR